MEKWTAALLLAILALGITACGGAEEATGWNTTTAEQKEATPTVDELIQKSMEAGKSLKSFSVERHMKKDVTISQGDQKQDMKFGRKIKIDLNREPLQVYQELIILGQNQDFALKQYAVNGRG
ncbi:hypothetical protein LQV63_21450 [Paenibacillus profundus]|uniref:DUF1310 family protein n=1 Tax=Paenibacillus profundus TaxID=1173085 RepID=A0ABS8YQH9_9BACL|nr:DUF6612 family protein [Paenibacillus profundus]MCE5171849.1 hypothetical protein [Paenibacillus profundus]